MCLCSPGGVGLLPFRTSFHSLFLLFMPWFGIRTFCFACAVMNGCYWYWIFRYRWQALVLHRPKMPRRPAPKEESWSGAIAGFPWARLPFPLVHRANSCISLILECCCRRNGVSAPEPFGLWSPSQGLPLLRRMLWWRRLVCTGNSTACCWKQETCGVIWNKGKLLWAWVRPFRE